VKRKQQLTISLAALVVAASLVWVLFFIHTVGNLWSLATGRGFIIPEESSIFTFRVTEMNDGSGESWLYGEDTRYYYAKGDRDGLIYIAFPKAKTTQCPSFRAQEWTTWCAEFKIVHEST
jgi:hypothetical protein